jgi:catechol 2,3-dioxygenase-like lactoylglutathione lyase family enzyme
MVAMKRMFGSYSVSDIDEATGFYRDVLGMSVSAVAGTQGPVWIHGPDGHETMIYPKADHVPATFTVLNLSVEDIDRAVDELTAAGVEFQQGQGRFETDDRGIYRGEGHSVAWFTDPAGNVLSLVQEA